MFQDGELQADATILNPNAWFIRDVERGFVNFFIKSRFQDVCIHAGLGNPLKLSIQTCVGGTWNAKPWAGWTSTVKTFMIIVLYVVMSIYVA